jgi:hypothetical protein
MKILLDENAPVGLRRILAGHDARTAPGALLRAGRRTAMIRTLPPDEKIAKFAAYAAARDLR